MARRSAGILLYRRTAAGPEVLLVHPGGPFWAKRDAGVWSIPKGEVGADEAPEQAALREFSEETGFVVAGELTALGEFRQPSGKRVVAFALEGDLNANQVKSNLCTVEWPPRSGRQIDVPEIDRAAWFSLPEAMQKILAGQRAVIEALARRLLTR